MLTESSENVSINFDPNYVIRKNDSSVEFVASLEKLRRENPNRLICGHLNINSIRNKFEMLTNIIQGKPNILLVLETKINISFPSGQFIIPGFAPTDRFDRNNKGGGLLLYLREDIPSKIMLVFKLPIEGFLIEVNVYRKKWLSGCFYNPHKTYISDFLKAISKVLDLTTANYEHLFIMGDLDSEVKQKYLTEFCQLYNLKNLINMSTCFKNPSTPSRIDVMLTQIILDLSKFISNRH